MLEYFGHRPGFYIDVGASHPFRISNTYLLYRNGWRGITVEPIPFLQRRHRIFRRRDTSLRVAVGGEPGTLTFYQFIPSVLSTFDRGRVDELVRSGARLDEEREVEVITLAQLASQHVKGARVDLLSIDAEGLDLDILRSNDWAAMRPRLVVCETAAQDDRDAAIEGFMESVGYRMVHRIFCNSFFAPREESGAP